MDTEHNKKEYDLGLDEALGALDDPDAGHAETKGPKEDIATKVMRLELISERQQKDIEKLSDLLKRNELEIGLLKKAIEDARRMHEDITEDEFLSVAPSPLHSSSVSKNIDMAIHKKKRLKRILFVSFLLLAIYILASFFWNTITTTLHKSAVSGFSEIVVSPKKNGAETSVRTSGKKETNSTAYLRRESNTSQ